MRRLSPDTEKVIRGIEINFFVIDQAEEVSEEVFDLLMSRLGRWDKAQVPAWLLEEEERAGRPWKWHSPAGRAIPPGFLLLNCGLHDIMLHPGADSCQVPVDRYESNLEESLRCCAERALQAIWVRTTPVVEALHRARSPGFDRREADLAAYNTRADRVMGRHGIPTVDLHRFTLPFLPGGVVDHVHFGVEVRRLQGAFLAGFIQGRWSGLTEAGR
jgi:hypothetical protein